MRINVLISILFLSHALASTDECTASTSQDDKQAVCKETLGDDAPLNASYDGTENAARFYINGTWQHPVPPRRTDEVINPSTALPVATISLGGPADADAAVAAARDAFPSWSQRTTPDERRAHVERFLYLYRKRWKELARAMSVEMGTPIDMARRSQAGAGAYRVKEYLDALDHFEFERTVPGALDGSSDEEEDGPATTILMDPVGVVAAITPWNWPMNQVVLKVIPALLVGCTVVLKPSELAPLSAILFAEMMHDAGIPPGVFNLVNGEGRGVGAHLSAHPDVDMVSFTGSTAAGAAVSRAAADTFKRVSLELGGKGANIIFADVADDLADVVSRGVHGCFANSGQSCNAPTRMLVERTVYDEAVEVARSAAERVRVGPADESGDHIGPVVSEAQFDKIQRYIEGGVEEGGRLVAGGPGRPGGTNGRGFYVRPTVFADCDGRMTIMQEEVFGPVLCIAPFDTEEEALRIANDTPYGLTNYVHSRDRDRRRRMARALRSGMVEMNGERQDYGAPFGGMKASGNGREGGIYGLEEFCEVKAVTGWA